jgi:prevent-host-death family protein
MRDTYSLYQAKARLSAIVRQVREGRTVIVTVHGEPAVEIRPVSAGPGGLVSRWRGLEERGILVPAASRLVPGPGPRRPGALARFLAERD